jgi:hypothetical protein
MEKAKLISANLKDLIILANEQISEGHYEASNMVIKKALDSGFVNLDSAIDELANELALTKKELEEAIAKIPKVADATDLAIPCAQTSQVAEAATQAVASPKTKPA